jgi:hypothetical protein
MNAPVKDNQTTYWSGELERAKKRFQGFWDMGDTVVDTYRQQKADGADVMAKDKYNILYSSTETIRPNLYAQTPVPSVQLRNKDTATDEARVASLILESSLKYIQKEEDFDDVMGGVVEDFLLPGLGQGWVRYDASFEDKKGEDGEIEYKEDKKTPVQELLDEMVKIEYLYWQDFLMGIARTWKDVPWVAKRCWMTKKEATDRFGARMANMLTYSTREKTGREQDTKADTAEVWEIWNKSNKMVYWYGEGCPELLDAKLDPLKLKRFFPCPRPLRAIKNNRTMVPRALYTQYKSQAETLNVLTKRIRLLGEALRVTGLYDGSQVKMSDILNPSAGNRMIAVDAWALFAQNGGINGSVQWVPIDVIIKTLNELLKAREVCKAEIYEITGFSDVVRGVSKASETLGAQNIKADWAGARVKWLQAEVQRFARDLLALAGELIAEHCSPATLAVFSGVPIPKPEDVQAIPELQEQIKVFKGACDLIKSDIRRLANIDIETDSTLAANKEQELADRSQFLAASGAFLQQAVPAIEATPELGPLLGALLMFTVRSFPASRIIEDEFEKVTKAMANRPQDQDKDGKKAKAAADAEKAKSDAAIEQARIQVEGQKVQADAAQAAAKVQAEQQAEANRHTEKMAELELKRAELALRSREVAVKEQQEKNERFKVLHEAALAEEGALTDIDAEVAKDAVALAAIDDKGLDRDRDREAQLLDLDDRQADRDAAAEAQEATLEAQKEAQEAAASEPPVDGS